MCELNIFGQAKVTKLNQEVQTKLEDFLITNCIRIEVLDKYVLEYLKRCAKEHSPKHFFALNRIFLEHKEGPLEIMYDLDLRVPVKVF